ncbi:hypothetical protein LPJ53_002512 [Coemansia erecta]|uniref:Aldehyde dehydrogenase n=1 Tax=Coemansia erecta TaxID=147472 RepID=A0A9W8CTG3_9FUNG|nr:hypothetical protein LPJ53_002512 [Coemansia erecta]
MGKEHSAVSGALSESALEYASIDSIGGTVSSLRATFASGQTRSLDFRKQQLRALLAGMRAEKKALLDAVLLDLSKSAIETDMYEFSAVEFEIGLMLENMDKWARPQRSWLSMLQPVFLMSRSELRREPLGTVVIIGAWNYPIRLTLLPLVGALAAGNTVVVKPSEISSHTAVAIEHMIGKYMDQSVVRVVQGAAHETGELLKQHFDHYFYTGSGGVGRVVAKAAAEQLAGVTLELGGKCPAIVHADVGDLTPTAARIMWAKLTNAGQTCVAVDYVLVHRSVKDRLVDLLKEAAVGLYGESTSKSPDYGRIINDRNYKRLKDLLDRTEGTTIFATEDGFDEHDRFFPPVIVDGVQDSDSLLTEELFGPILPIVVYDTLDEAIAMVNSRDQPLALYVFAASASAQHVLAQTRSGGACVNDTMFHLASHGSPFGGVGPSGVGNYTGQYSFNAFSHHRHVLLRPLWFPSPGIDTIRGAPFSGPENEWKLKLCRPMAYPAVRPLRDSFFGRLVTFFPLWRLLAILPGFIVALFTAKPLIRRRK